MLFISFKNSFCPRDTDFFVFFFLTLHGFLFTGSHETGVIMMAWIDLHKLANAVFRITQTQLCIKSSKLSRGKISKKEIF